MHTYYVHDVVIVYDVILRSIPLYLYRFISISMIVVAYYSYLYYDCWLSLLLLTLLIIITIIIIVIIITIITIIGPAQPPVGPRDLARPELGAHAEAYHII